MANALPVGPVLLATTSTQALSTIVTVEPDSALAYSASSSPSGLPVYRTPSRSRSLMFPLPVRSVSARTTGAAWGSGMRTRRTDTTAGPPSRSAE